LWNEGKRTELDQLFRSLGPNGFTIEYVGAEPVDGVKAMEDMWAEYGGKCTTEALEVIFNGSEGAAYIANHMQSPDGVLTIPSLETYKITDGRLTIRYFHRTAH